jgi:signal transduction histidine kinase
VALSRRALTLPLLALGLVLLLAVLATLQYRWLGQVSEAERSRLRQSAQARLDAFARDFDREVTRAYLMLQVDPDTLRQRDWAGYARRFEQWRTSAPHAALVKEVLVAEATGGQATLWRFDANRPSFAPIPWPAELGSLRRQIEESLTTGGPPLVAAVEDDPLVLVSPVPALLALTKDALHRPSSRVTFQRLVSQGTCAYTLVILDAAFVRGRLLPELVEREFGAEGSRDYDLTMVSRRDPAQVVFRTAPEGPAPSDAGDASVNLLAMRFDELDASLLRGLLPAPLHEIAKDHLTVRVAATTRGPSGALGGMDPGGRWRAVLTHRAGSVEAAVAGVRRRNLAVSFSILGLLGASTILIALSSQRARTLAARQVEFVAGVSHELRTPLAVIRSAAENLADGVVEDGAAVRRYGTVIRDEGVRLSDMVEQVLELAGAESGRRAAPRAVALCEVVARVAAEAAPSLAAAGVALETSVPSALPPVSVEPAALERALHNLLSNARKHAFSGGWVEDGGPGFDPGDARHLFEPFFRGRRAVDDQVPGSGLGLSLVRRLVEAQGGRVAAAPRAGSGAVFTIHLPVAADPGPQAAPAAVRA